MKLDLRYRPQKFDQVLGNDVVKKLLLTRSKNHSLSNQSSLFGGPKGCGKTTLARLVARALVCTSLVDGEPCGQCVACVSSLNETNNNIEELDAASKGTVDKIRAMVKDSEYESSPGSNIYIIDEAQRLSASAQDALLKAIEDRVLLVIMCTTEPHKIREPIRSRVEEYSIQPPSPDDLCYRIKDICRIENIKVEEDAIYKIIKIHRGCPRSCLISIESLANFGPINHNTVSKFFGFDNYDLILQILRHIDTKPALAFEMLDKLSINETPTWIRHNMVLAMSSIMRQRIKINHTYPVSITDDFSPNIIEIAQDLVKIEKPIISDIEAVLLKRAFLVGEFRMASTPAHAPISVPTSAPAQILTPTHVAPAPAPAPVSTSPPALISAVKVETESVKTVEFDGVKFSSNENLTSLDAKVMYNSSTDKNEVNKETDVVSVKLDKNHVPLTEKQFIEKFINKYKGKGSAC